MIFEISVIETLITIFYTRQYEIRNQFTEARKTKTQANYNRL